MGAPVVVVLTLVGLVAGHLFLGLLAGLVLGAALAGAVWRTAEARVIRMLGAVPADPSRFSRYHNLVEGLCAAAGLPKPELLVVESGAPNALAVGRSPRQAAIVATTGLLDQLTRMELEGVLAHELSHIKSLDILPATVAAILAKATGRRLPGDPVKETSADRNGVSITRYPPGLVAALEKLAADPAAPPGPPAVAHLWLESSAPLEPRIAALREL
jgi:heat shock protein HtpX